jgi:hypothetical protein
MTACAGPGSSAVEVQAPGPGSLESRASLALKILAGINAAGIILAMIPGTIPTSTLATFAFHLALGVLAAAEQPPEPEPVTIGASYIHVGVWRHDASAVTCSW